MCSAELMDLKGATGSKATTQLFKTVMIQDKGTASIVAVFISKYQLACCLYGPLALREEHRLSGAGIAY
jgi:hypothetical protein